MGRETELKHTQGLMNLWRAMKVQLCIFKRARNYFGRNSGFRVNVEKCLEGKISAMILLGDKWYTLAPIPHVLPLVLIVVCRNQAQDPQTFCFE